MDPTVTTTITDIITNLGLPASMVLALGWFLYKLINKMMSSHEENIKKYQDALEKSQTLNLNHGAHIQACMEQLNIKLEKHDESLEKVGEKIVGSIEKQTDLLRESLKRD